MVTGFLALVATVSALQQTPAIHYRITIRSARNVDRTSTGEEARGGTFTALAFVTATTTIEPKGRFAHVVIDSVTCSGTGMLSMAYDSVVGQRSRGARYDFPIGSHMEAVPLPTISNTLTNTLAQTAVMLYPNLAPDAPIGAMWTDSLDASSMTDALDKNHPVTTRWKVTAAGGDTAVVEGDVRGTIAFPSRMVGTGLVTGSRRLTIGFGMLRMQTSTTKQETLMVPDGASAITVGTATTSLEIVRLP